MARRLSDDFNYSVAVLEAGSYQDNDPNIVDSNTSLQSSFYENYFWQESTTPQTALQGRILQYTGGRVLGGSSSVNGEQWVRGTTDKYNEWVALTGDSAWSPNNVINMFKQIENYVGTSEDQAVRGHNGKLTIRQVNEPITNPTANKITTAFQQAAQQAGVNVPIVEDYNTEPSSTPNPPNVAFSAWQVTQSASPSNYGTRVNSSIAYLDDVITLTPPPPDNTSGIPNYAIGKNGRQLYVLFKTTVVKILFKGNKAIGAKFIHKGKENSICARKVIVTAGINSSWILQVSGVGPANILESAGIPVIVNNPQIGQNLKDHVLIVSTFLNETTDAPVDPNTSYVGGLFVPLPNTTIDSPRTFEVEGFYIPNSPIFVIVMYFINPKSSGSVNILTNDPLKVPLPNPNYLSNPDDIDSLIAGIQSYLLNITNILSGQGYVPLNLTSDTINNTPALKSFIQANAGVSYHYSSSNRMATQAQGGAVDSSGRVYGTKNLIVADDSAQPSINNGNTQSNAYLIGWKISQDLINERPLKKSHKKKCKYICTIINP